MAKYDYLIVGAGLFGSTFARQMTDRGAKCLVIDKRKHIGGNCYTENLGGIHVHKYGPHVFHTNSKVVWDYVNRFAEFNNFTNRIKVNFRDSIYSFPINLFTLYQLWGCKTPAEAKTRLEQEKIPCENPSNLEEWILSQVGQEIYDTFIYGYTTKQWGREPKDLPASIIKRLPIRLSFEDNYYNDIYQGVPIHGYTSLVSNLLEKIPVVLECDYLENRVSLDKMATKVVYTGPLDEFFCYDHGILEWRSLRFETKVKNDEDFQGNAIINFTDKDVPYTRCVEHKHFTNPKALGTIITYEYPDKWDQTKEKYYPINTEENQQLVKKYQDMIDKSKYVFGGRLADYQYYDMHHVIGSALSRSAKECQ